MVHRRWMGAREAFAKAVGPRQKSPHDSHRRRKGITRCSGACKRLQQMNSFHRTKRDSGILGYVGLAIAFVMSMAFMLVGFGDIGNKGGINAFQVIFGTAGACLFVVVVRGCWMTAGGALTHVFSINEDEIEWGFVGKEKQLATADVEEIYWDDTDGFTFLITRKDGSRVRFPYMQNVVGPKSRGKLLAFLRRAFPEIRITGRIEKKTEQDAAGAAA